MNVIHENGLSVGGELTVTEFRTPRSRITYCMKIIRVGSPCTESMGRLARSATSFINNTIVQAPNSRWAVNIKNQEHQQNVVVNNILLHSGPQRGSTKRIPAAKSVRTAYRL